MGPAGCLAAWPPGRRRKLPLPPGALSDEEMGVVQSTTVKRFVPVSRYGNSGPLSSFICFDIWIGAACEKRYIGPRVVLHLFR